MQVQMKNIAFYIMAAGCMWLAGCSVKEKILDEQDGSQLVSDPKNIESLVSPAYAYLRDLQNRSGVWGTLEGTTDELAWPARGSDWVSPDLQTLYTHEYTPTNSYIRNTFNSFMLGITKCNVALQYLAQFPADDKVNTYVAEVKFIRALCMFRLADCFGQFPFREYQEYDYSTYPQILSREQAITRTVAELQEIIPQLKTKAQLPYGRVSKAAAQMLLANVYLNHQVHTGTAKWNEAIAQCDAIINSGEYLLADDYWKMFQYNNAAYLHSTESILSVIYDETLALTGADWVRITLHYNQKFGNFSSLFNGCCTSPEFVNTWDTTDLRFKDTRNIATLGFNQGLLMGQQYSPGGAALKTRTGELLSFTKDFSIKNSKEQQGVRVLKFAPNPSTTNTAAAGNDFPYYRLADTYLMRAEARMRNGDKAGAMADINTLRSKRKRTLLTDLTLTDIFNERGYELYWEGNRRTDMIRFGNYTAARSEKSTVTPDYKILLPIPLSAIEANPNLKQNPGY